MTYKWKDAYPYEDYYRYFGKTGWGNQAKGHINIRNGQPETDLDLAILKYLKQEAKEKGFNLRIRYRGPHAPTRSSAHTRKANAWGAAIYFEKKRDRNRAKRELDAFKAIIRLQSDVEQIEKLTQENNFLRQQLKQISDIAIGQKG